ncbi:MAG: class I SAM-dependent methyltransferase [Candidatus Mariimomonas ferrooxydans]
MLKTHYEIEIPDHDSRTLSQDKEYCIVKDKKKNETRRIGLHEYGKIYSIPGLYEYLFYDKLQCKSPEKVCELLTKEVGESTTNIEELTVLDLGAGNGMVGEQLRECGVKSICGVDIEKEAKKAIVRDRPDVYEDYFVADLMNTPDDIQRDLEEKSFDCMTTVAALGFGDIPPKVFAEGFNLISVSGWVAFNIKETFLSDNDSTGFSYLINRMIDNGILEIHSQERYKHRLSTKGEPLYYIAIIGEKITNIPESWLEPAVQNK